MPSNYNNAAWFYDGLSRLIYGGALIQSQVYLLQFIPANANVLIVGGGTGAILNEITKIHPSGLQITYVEIAPKMIARSKKRNTGLNKVIFINDSIENVSPAKDFDLVITVFLFDSFTRLTANKVFTRIHSLLKPGGLWLYADFQAGNEWWQKVLLKAMFLFFRLICNIEASKLPDTDKVFEQYGYQGIAGRAFFGEFIISKVYKTA